MTTKWKWLIGLSLVLNLFLIAAITGAVVVIGRHMHDFRRSTPVAQQWSEADKRLTPQSRLRIHAVVRQAALAGEPDLDRARDIRAQAAQLAAAQPYDAARITALSGEARGYEDQARAKVENALIQAMAGLEPDERAAIANHMLRASFRFRYLNKDRDRGDHATPPESASAAP